MRSKEEKQKRKKYILLLQLHKFFGRHSNVKNLYPRVSFTVSPLHMVLTLLFAALAPPKHLV